MSIRGILIRGIVCLWEGGARPDLRMLSIIFGVSSGSSIAVVGLYVRMAM